ncbi:MAG: hypothetical protein F4246_11730 [Rhodothermaceae bacterium]|nr:hypothetical protein [Rhodothermaceae bacterium]MXX57475.1 hypothetical protein [Rhodothermaceae bacterium]MYD19550.1 hypothetical protein [Rhodothermaceae bacterium]MYD57664.1 hypothetical protein [Rhodothermaceae bacterium]MYI44058.1 hypothetical protein [Rhodothermaceae bacterium]
MYLKTALAFIGGLLGICIVVIAAYLVPNYRAWVSGIEQPLTEHHVVVATAPGNSALIEKLQRTLLLNGSEIHDRLDLADPSGSRNQIGFLTINPYEPAYQETYIYPDSLRYPMPDDPHSFELAGDSPTFVFRGQEPVLQWYSSLSSNTEVCAVGFVDSTRVRYQLRTFPDPNSAVKNNFIITHRHHCGTCSSLHDLAIYLEKPDLVAPAKKCAKKLKVDDIKACLMEDVGLGEDCSETWTYNVLHTRRHCTTACVGYYGLWNVLTNNMSKPPTNEHGNLNPCLACDEYTSGPGFQYAAGRTRRASGLVSAIPRPEADIYKIDHQRYFNSK